MNDLPVKYANGAIVYMRDVAQVRDGFAVQGNIVRENGRRSTLISVIKNGQASTLDIVNAIKERASEDSGRTAPCPFRAAAL